MQGEIEHTMVKDVLKNMVKEYSYGIPSDSQKHAFVFVLWL